MAGNRKPSSERRFRSAANVPGSAEDAVAARYAFAASRGRTCRSWNAIASTFVIRSAISRRVKPSGKTIRNGFGGAGSAVVAGLDEPRSFPIATAAPQPSPASTTAMSPSATARRTTTWRRVGDRRLRLDQRRFPLSRSRYVVRR